ncbi:UNVERIFIED_CONTAM: hypothetical protein HDU68_008991 [Siphonaria sp. JEL0065]|nr:hypothetical protein HDU68_008991 [Siphonaria sp. JEL0065]
MFIKKRVIVVCGFGVSLVVVLALLQMRLVAEPESESVRTTTTDAQSDNFAAESLVVLHSKPPPHSQLVVTSDKTAVLPSHPNCPSPRPALIGILTISDDLNSLRRQFLREQYRAQNALLSDDHKIDFMFLLGREKDYEKRYQIQTEQQLHPFDTLITNRTESKDEGKIYDWFHYARSVMYSKHPSIPNAYCKRYSFVGKAEDDETINVPVLSEALRALNSSNSHFVGYPVAVEQTLKLHKNLPKMHGMLYFVNAEMVEWISFSDIPKSNLVGPESHQVSKWLHKSGINIQIVNWRTKYHETTHAISFENQPISKNTIVVHPCKHMFFTCMSYMFERISADHDFMDLETASSHLESLSLTFPQAIIQQSLIYMHNVFLQRDPTTPTISLPEFEYGLLHYTLKLHLTQSLGISLSDATTSTVILHILNLNRIGGKPYLKPTLEATNSFLISSIVESRMMHKGFMESDVHAEQMAEIVEGTIVAYRGGAITEELDAIDPYWIVVGKKNIASGGDAVVNDETFDFLLTCHAVMHGLARLGLSSDIVDDGVEGVMTVSLSLMNSLGRGGDLQDFLTVFLAYATKKRAIQLEGLTVSDVGVKIVQEEVKKVIVGRLLEKGEFDAMLKKVFGGANGM